MRPLIERLARGRAWWGCLLLLGIALEAVALYYQYRLDYGPCVLCIHVRLWIAAWMLLAVLGLLLDDRPHVRRLLHGLNTLVMAILVERSWRLLGVERGFIDGSCEMDAGLPDWLALDRWWPQVFEPWEPCGYTPELAFGITMAEALLVMSLLLGLVSALLAWASLRARAG